LLHAAAFIDGCDRRVGPVSCEAGRVTRLRRASRRAATSGLSILVIELRPCVLLQTDIHPEPGFWRDVSARVLARRRAQEALVDQRLQNAHGPGCLRPTAEIEHGLG